MMKLPWSRRGVELAINTLVVIILGVVMLGAGLFLFVSLFGAITETVRDVDEVTKAKLREEMMRAGDNVLADYTIREIRRGKFGQFNVGVHNVLADSGDGGRAFFMEVSLSGCYDLDLVPFPAGCPEADDWLEPPPAPGGTLFRRLEPPLRYDEDGFLAFGVKIPEESLESGRYEFTVDACEWTARPEDVEPSGCGPDDGPADNPPRLYPPRLKVYVDVP